MNQQTIQQLNQLNTEFYQTTAQTFDRTRQYYWAGWRKILPEIDKLVALAKRKKRALRVLDIGCGNGRFALFLHDHLQTQFIFHGLDNNEALLHLADKSLTKKNIDHQLFQQDLIANLHKGKILENEKQKYDLIVMFGVIHHVPSFALRLQLVNKLGELLNNNGILVVTAWQFAAGSRYQNRYTDPQKLGIDPEQLEKNDFILDWQKGEQAFRYCHYVDADEINQMQNQLKNLKLTEKFKADGKNEKLNQYLIFT